MSLAFGLNLDLPGPKTIISNFVKSILLGSKSLRNTYLFVISKSSVSISLLLC